MTYPPVLILGGAGKIGRRIATQLGARGVDFRLASRSSAQRFDCHESRPGRLPSWGRTRHTWPLRSTSRDSRRRGPVRQACRDQRVAADGAALRPRRRQPGRDFAVYDSQLALEHAVKDSGLDWTIVQPAWFMQKFSEGFTRDYVLAGEIRLSAGDGAEAWIDSDGVGDVVTEALLDERHIGETYALSGPRLLTLTDVAAEQSAATARQIDYAALDPDEHVAEMIAVGVPRTDAEALRELFTVIRHHRSEYISDRWWRVLRREPRDFTQWARTTAAAGAWQA